MSKARQLADLGNQVDDGAITGTNMVINGGMTVAQRGVSATGVNSSGYYTVDRFRVRHDTSSTSTLEQVSDAPNGFNNSLKLTTTSAGSIGSNESLRFDHMIESRDLQQLKFGTSDAATFTISFWVKSSIAGNYSLNVYQFDGSKQVNDTYTINTANTWEYKSITFIGNTGNANANDSSSGFEVAWFMAAGSSIGTGSQLTSWTSYTGANYGVGQAVDISGTTGATFQITGVCLNVGDSAIDFPHESYAETLAKCQRYTYIISGAGYTPATDSAYARYFMFGTGSTSAKWLAPLPVPMRSTPSLITNNFTSSTVQVYSYTDDAAKTLSSISLAEGGIYQSQVNFIVSGSGLGDTLTWRWNNSPAAYIGFEAEL